MKALKYFASALALVALFTACEEESEYQPAQLPDTQEAYFPATTMTVSMEELANGFEVELARVNYDEAATATLKSVRPEGVNVPSSVSFNAGQEKTTFTVSVDQAALGEGKTFKIEMNVDSESNSPYANQRCTVTLTTWSPTPPASWRPIETQALFVERQSLSAEWFNVETGHTFPVYVEKLDGSEVYRIANLFSTYTSEAGVTYKHPYWYYYYDESYLENPNEVHYTYIDCEGYYWEESEKADWKQGWAFMPLQSQNFGLNPPAYGYNYWGSFGYTFQGQTPSDTNMGKYDIAGKSITFGPGTLVRAMSLYNGGGYYTSAIDFTLYLDQNLAGTDFERDCAFEKISDATLSSQIAGGKWDVALYEGVPADKKKAKEYEENFGQVLKVENAYTEGYPVYFCVNAEGKISVPEEYEYQEMGQSMSGFDLYLNIKKGAFENNLYTLECTMIGVDPAGVKADINFAEYTEVISVEQNVTAETVDAFCGEWNFSGVDYSTGEAFTYPATIEKISENQAALKGLLDPSGKLNDAIVMDFIDGELYLAPQDLGVTTETGYDVMVNTIGYYQGDGPYFFEPVTSDDEFAPGMVLQLTDAGNIKIVDDPINAMYGAEIVAFYYAAYQDGEYLGYFTEFYSQVEMAPASSTAAAAAKAVSVTISKGSKFTGELVKGEVDRRAKVGNQRAEIKTKAEFSRQVKTNVRNEFVTL